MTALFRTTLLASLLLASFPATWAQNLTQDQAPTSAAAAQAASEADASAGTTMPPPPPEDAGSMIRLSQVVGDVEVYSAANQLLGPATLNMSLTAGMRLQTSNDGQAELQFPDGAIARLAPSSGLSVLSGEEGAARLRPTSGLSYFELPAGRLDQVELGPFAMRADGTNGGALLRVDLDHEPAQAAVLQGGARLTALGGEPSFAAAAGSTVTIDPSDPNNYDLATGITADSWDAWNTDRDQALAELAGAGHGEGPGWNDLDYYGTWYDLPGAGLAWAPDGVDANFDPYGSGAWDNYVGGSYGWASAYPWGWLPSHCGVWNWWPEGGWLWQPGGCVWGAGSVWYGYPRLGTTPRGYRPLPRPLPPRGIQPRLGSVIAVNRAPQTGFRVLGGPRPPHREIALAGQPVEPLTPALGTSIARPMYPGPSAAAHPAYGSAGGASGFLSGNGEGRITPAPRVLEPVPRVLVPAAPQHVFVPSPRPAAPAPAPRFSPPPAAAHGR